MKPRLPSWTLTPALILLAFGAILIIGKSAMVAQNPPPPVGDSTRFPDFSGETADGGTFHLADQKGKVVLVNFWATWCGPCQMEIPDLIALQKKYGPRGFVVVGLSEDSDLKTAAAFVKQTGITYPILKTPDVVHQAVPVSGLPTSFLLDRQGAVVKTVDGIYPNIRPQDMWAPEIEKVL